MLNNPYSAFWGAIRDEEKGELFYQAVMTGGASARMGTIPLDKNDLLINSELTGRLKSGDKVLLAPIEDGQRFVILCKVVAL